MNRRSFIRKGMVFGAASAFAMPMPALAKGVKQIRMVTTWPRGFAGLGTSAQRLADRITSVSNGRLNVKLYAAGELVPAFKAFDAVASGEAHLYHATEVYWKEKHKAFNFFGAVPLGMTSLELDAWIHHGGGQELWDELSGQFGVKCFICGNTGVQMGGWYKKPVRSLEDMRALRMRIAGLGAEVINRLGGQAVTLPGAEIFPAIKNGKLNAAEWNGPYNDKEFGFHRILKDYMFPGFHEPGTGKSLGINRKFWDSLASDEKEILKASALAEGNYLTAEFNARNGLALQELTNVHGVKLHIYPKDVWSVVAKVSQEVVAEVGSKSDRLGRKIFQSWNSFQKQVSAWQQISDISYTAFRALSLRR